MSSGNRTANRGRGPRPRPAGEVRHEAVILPCTPAEKAQIQAAARAAGHGTVADYLRALVGLPLVQNHRTLHGPADPGREAE